MMGRVTLYIKIWVLECRFDRVALMAPLVSQLFNGSVMPIPMMRSLLRDCTDFSRAFMLAS